MQDQNQVRREIRAQRRALSPKEQENHSLAMCRILSRTSMFRNSRKIAIYIENDGEIGVTRLISRILNHHKRCYLPALRPMPPNRLWFCQYKPGDRLVKNKYGIIEPNIQTRKPIPPWELDLVLIPLVFFDLNGNRVGMGGGFYDRTFSYLKTRSKWRKPKLIGVAHELQLVDSIQPNTWDIPLDGVVTESHLYKLKFYKP